MVFADLHTRSTASDGQYCPEEVVKKSKDAGIRVIALTDHDTMAGIPAAVEMGNKIGVQVIRGIEV